MSGIGLSVAEVQRWSAAAVREVFHVGQARARAALDAADGLAALEVFRDWGGDTALAAHAAIGRTRMDLDAHGAEALAVAHAAGSAADRIEAVQCRLRSLIVEAHRHGLTVNEVTGRIEFGQIVCNPAEALIYRLDLQPRLDAILAEADAIDDTLAGAVDMADGDLPIPAVGGPSRSREDRLQHRVDAFTALFDRPPSSTADWATAAHLDPHSYEPKNQGVPPSIAVGRIQPVPGQGVVRANLFIPSATVKDPVWQPKWPPVDDNAGDHRGFDPLASPEASRVALQIDYENGLVVARQNPSVNVSTGRVRVGSPRVEVAQRRDGAVYIDYAAADPFSPGGEAVAKASICVQGQVAVQPGPDGPRIGGTVTGFPALEVYHDRTVGNGVDMPSTRALAQLWPRDAGQWGPAKGLWYTTDIGDSQLPAAFSDPSYRVPRMPVLTTALGPVSNPPTVRVVG